MKFMRHLTEPAPLFDMPEGKPLQIADVQGSPDLRSKLYAMGLLPGTPIKICNRSCGQGSLCVRVRHCSLVIGEALARAIVCRPDIGHGHRHGHGIRHGHGSEIRSPEGGPCPRPEGVDIMELRECVCPDDKHGARAHGTGGHGGGEREAGSRSAGGRGGRGGVWRFFAC